MFVRSRERWLCARVLISSSVYFEVYGKDPRGSYISVRTAISGNRDTRIEINSFEGLYATKHAHTWKFASQTGSW